MSVVIRPILHDIHDVHAEGGGGGSTDKIISPDTNSDLTITDTHLVYNDSFATPRLLIEDTATVLTSPNWSQIFYADNNNIAMRYLGTERVNVTGPDTILKSPDSTNIIKVNNTGAYYNDVALNNGTVVSSVSWNANTTSSGEATTAYKKNHLSAYRLAPGIWSIENEGTNPLMPGDSAGWITNSIGNGTSDPFFLAEMNIIAFGQPSSGHPVTMTISGVSVATSPNTGNLGSMIIKIKDKDGVVSDPTLADAFATVKLTYIV